jgi:thiamine biosynthesis lipoprotein
MLICLSFVDKADAGGVTGWSGSTMGTSYSVKVYAEDDSALDYDALRVEVDGELRRVNDEMSTYLKSSQISQFNNSTSTDWFQVSQSFAEVVAYAQEVATLTGGAFDVTVGTLTQSQPMKRFANLSR